MIKIFLNFKNIFKKYLFPFYKRNDLKKFFRILEKDKSDNKEVAMFVGGCVRNYLKFKKIEDIDIATVYSPDEIKEKFKNTNFKIFDTGLDHGTVTVVLGKKKIELTTLRKDIKTDGRHAEIQMIDNWKEDSNRRDFTFNAIYLNKNGKTFDPQLGINDLKNSFVKFIGDPQKRIEEDYLRIIRFIRFSIQYKSKVEPSTLQAIKINLNGIKLLSKERILSELFKIFKLDNFSEISDNKDLLFIFSLIFPEFKYLKRLSNFKNLKKFFNTSNLLILSILLVDEGNNHEYFSHKYKVSKKIKDNLVLLSQGYKNIKNEKDFFKGKIKSNIYMYGAQNFKTLYCLHLLEKKNYNTEEINFINKIEKISIPKFPYDGSFLLKKGIKEGKNIGIILKEAEKYWFDNNFNLSLQDLDIILKKHADLN